MVLIESKMADLPRDEPTVSSAFLLEPHLIGLFDSRIPIRLSPSKAGGAG